VKAPAANQRQPFYFFHFSKHSKKGSKVGGSHCPPHTICQGQGQVFENNFPSHRSQPHIKIFVQKALTASPSAACSLLSFFCFSFEKMNRKDMKTTVKKEVKGTQGVNASQTKPATATTNNAKPASTAAAAKAETVPLHKTGSKPRTIEDHIKHFDGLAQLVTMKRRVEKHRDKVRDLEVSDVDIADYDAGKAAIACITLCDDQGREYEIDHPLLVKEVQRFIGNSLDRKITDYDQKIMAYAS
jgi:hypothetical protein